MERIGGFVFVAQVVTSLSRRMTRAARPRQLSALEEEFEKQLEIQSQMERRVLAALAAVFILVKQNLDVWVKKADCRWFPGKW